MEILKKGKQQMCRFECAVCGCVFKDDLKNCEVGYQAYMTNGGVCIGGIKQYCPNCGVKCGGDICGTRREVK